MRKQELDNWIKSGGDLPQNLTGNEKSYLEGLGWECVETRYTNKEKESEDHYLNRERHGKREGWHGNGKKAYEDHYLHGKAHGVWKMWHRNGEKFYEYQWSHGKEHGVWKVWEEDGTLRTHKEYAYGVLLKDFLK